MTNKLVRAVQKQYIPGRAEVPPSPGYCYTVEKRVLTGYEYPPPQEPFYFDNYSGPSGGGVKWQGYPTPIYGINPETGQQELIGYAPMRNAPPQPKYVTRTEKICVPAKPGIPGIPSKIVLHNAGPDWRASARSVKSLAGGAAASFDLPEKPRVMIGFAVQDRGAVQADLRMGIYTVPAGSSGTLVYPILDGVQSTNSFLIPSGARVTLLRYAGTFAVLADGVAMYSTAATTEQEVFLDALVYTTNDYVDNPALASVETLTGISTRAGFSVGLTPTTGVTGSVGLRGQVGSVVDGQVLAQVRGAVGFSGVVDGTASSVVSVYGSVGLRVSGMAREYSGAQLALTPLWLSGADYAVTNGAVVLPRLQVEGAGGLSVPEVAGGDLVMAPMVSTGVMLTGGLLHGGGTLPRLAVLAADRPYAEVRMELRPMRMYADAGWVLPNYYGHNDPMVLRDSYTLDPALIAVFVDNLGIATEMSLAVMVEGAFFDGALLTDGLSVHALIELLIESGLTLTSATQLPYPELAQLAFNTAAGAATRYEGFGFTGFVYTDEGTFAVKPDGVYRLRQGDDDGATRSALVEFGAASFGGSQKKHIHTMYLGTGGDGTLYVKLSPDGRGYKTYRVVGQQPTQRVHTGKGLTAREWTLRLEWVDMTEAELDAVEFVIAGSSRRWVR